MFAVDKTRNNLHEKKSLDFEMVLIQGTFASPTVAVKVNCDALF